MSIPEKYKVDHLFLLIGENPLPNYVAARTLLQDGGQVYLVFTNQTKFQKNCLLGVDGLKSFGIKSIEIDLAYYESNAYYIRDIIQKKVQYLTNGKIGLNYTGGTKAMAVHAYQAIYELRSDTIFSYLDPRKLKMCIEQARNQPIFFDLRLNLCLKEIFRLHNKNYWLDKKPPRSTPFFPDAAVDFADFHHSVDKNNKDKTPLQQWRTWCNEELYPKTKKENSGRWKNEDELNSQAPIIISLARLDQHIINILQQHFNAFDKELCLDLDLVQKKGFESLTHVCEWLDGTWLENYVLHQIKEIQAEFAIKESMMSFHIRDSTATYRERFEFDVAFVKGYQLFAISCTTSSSKERCKEKLFEAHLRARQLGGDEARVALVCCYDKPDWIKDDMRFAIDDRKIEVFGRQDLVNLAEGIAEWIERNNQEANA